MRLIAGAVQRLLDRQHHGVGRGLAQQVHHRGKALERVVQQNVALADGVEQVIGAAKTFGQSGRKHGIFQIGSRHQVIDRRETVQIDRPGHRIPIERSQRELPQQECDHFLRTIRRGLQPHRRAVAAMGQLTFERAAQVVHFLVIDEQVAVARQSELVTTEHLHAREQPGDECLDDGGQGHQPLVAARRGQRQDARQRSRRLHDGHVAVATEGVLAGKLDDEIQALVLYARKRPRRVEPQRAQYRFHLVGEVLLEPGVGVGVPFGAREQLDAFRIQVAQQHLVERPVLILDQSQCSAVNRRQLFADAEGVGRGLRGTQLQQLLETGNADLEEFVEVGRADAQEPQALQQRHAWILGLRQHPGIELQCRQFAVDEVLRCVQGQLIQVRTLRRQLSRHCKGAERYNSVTAAKKP